MTCMLGMSFKDQNLREKREAGNGGEEGRDREKKDLPTMLNVSDKTRGLVCISSPPPQFFFLYSLTIF